MIFFKYYNDYRGTQFNRFKIWKHGEEKLDITEYMKEFYGYER